jgi:NAD(P)-dependent dehydrogenase (short-subunit alcohol dehydrogenase family)
MSRLLRFLHQAWTPPTNPTTPFTGKTIIVTGANSGLGFEAALKLLQLNASLVILAVRDIERGEAAKEEILRRVVGAGKEIGVDEGGSEIEEKVRVWECDMSDYRSVVRFVERVGALERVDCAVLNAGVFGVEFRVREGGYGWEEVLQVNVL